MSPAKSVYKKLPKRLPKSKGFSRYSLDFDGAEDYVEVPHDSSLNFLQSVTVLAWAKFEQLPSDAGHDMYVFRKYRDGYQMRGESVDMIRLHWLIGGSWVDAETSSGYIETGKWYFIAGTYDGSALKLYINGDLKASTSTTGDIATSTDPLTIGQEGTDSDYINGVIAEVAFYDRVLTQSEIRDIMLNYHNVSKNGLVGWWRFQEGTGLTTHDESGTGNDGTLTPSGDPPVWTPVKKWELRTEVGL